MTEERAAKQLVPPRGKVRLGSGAAYGLGGQVVGVGTSFLIGILVARLLGVEGKGILSIVMQVVAILFAALNLGIAGANVYFVAKGRVEPSVAAGNSLVAALLLGALGAPIVIGLLTGRFAVVEGISRGTILLAVLSLPLVLFAAALAGVSSGLGDLRLPFLFTLASSVTTLVALAALVAVLSFEHVTVGTVVGVSALGTVVGIGVLIGGMWHHILPLHSRLGPALKMAHYSGMTHIAGVAGYLHNRQDILILGWLAGAGAVGLYSVGVSFAELLWYVPSALGSAILAKAPSSSNDSAQDYVCRSSRISILFMLAIMLVAIPLAPKIMALLYGSAFQASAIAFFILLPGAFADGAMRPAWSYHAARERIFWREATGTMLLNVVLNLVLVPRMGFAGAAVASSVSYIVLACIVLGSYVRETGVPLGQLLVPRRSDVSIAVRTMGTMVSGVARRTGG